MVTAVGKAVADEYIRTKAIHFQRNEQLPADTILKFPYTHLYQNVKQVWSDMNEVENGHMAMSSGSVTAEDAEVFHSILGEADAAAGRVPAYTPQIAQLHGVKQEVPPEPEAIQGVEKSGKELQEEATKLCKEVSRVHADWDRKKRDITSLLDRAGMHPLLGGESKIYARLAKLLSQGNSHDADLMSFENYCKNGSKTTLDLNNATQGTIDAMGLLIKAVLKQCSVVRDVIKLVDEDP